MSTNFCNKLSGRGIQLWILCLAAAFATNVTVAESFTSGSDGSDGAYDLTGTTPGTIVKFSPTQFQGSGVQNNVFNFTTITIPAGVTVKLSGDSLNGPVYWLAQGDVDIEGTVDLDGQAGPPPAAILAARTRAIPGAGGFAGGVGGKYDTFPIPPGEPGAQPGDGPGGGSVSSEQCAGSTYGLGGQNTSNAFLVPLVGGSGGAGTGFAASPGTLSQQVYGGGGGAGGGAILLASSATIAVNGTITANGGAVGGNNTGCSLGSGGGAGGSIRLAALTISGGGTLTALGGRGANPPNPGGNGFIRLEAFTDNFTGSFNGTPESMGSPFSTFIPANGPPTVTVINVNGVNVTQPPTGSLATPDAAIDTGAPVDLTIQARFIPPGTVLTLKVFSDNNTDQIVQTTPLLGTLESSTATATVTFPSGFSLNYVRATWTP